MMTEDGTIATDKYGQPVILGKRPPTVTGLALALGFTQRKSLIDYAKREGFADIIAMAKSRVEMYCEERLFDRDGVKGAMFSLQNNFGWAQEDKKEESDSGTGIAMIPQVLEGG